MNHQHRYFFSVHETLIMAALAALGGVSGAAVSNVRAALHTFVVLPGGIGMQFLAGIHVVWLVLAVGLVRKPGAATITCLLQGGVEVLSGSPHGVLVLVYTGLAGLCVDLAWILLGRRDHLVVYVIVGALGTATNALVIPFLTSFSYGKHGVVVAVLILAGVALVSGAVLAGLLGWWLLRILRMAGVTGAHGTGRFLRGERTTPR